MAPSSLRDQAYHIIYGQIAAGSLARGTVTSEVQLSAQLDMSRTPVRAALQRLETEGFVKIIPKHGVLVQGASAQRAGDLLEMIAALLMFAAGSARQLDPEGLDKLSRALAGEFRSVLHAHPSGEGAEALCAFELAAFLDIAALARNQEMKETLGRCASRLFWHRSGKRWTAPYRKDMALAMDALLLHLPASDQACNEALQHYLRILKTSWS